MRPHKHRGNLFRRVRNLEEKQMANQAEIDQLTQELTDAKSNIESEIQALEDQIASGTGASELDLTGLKTAVGNIASIQKPNPTLASPGASTAAPIAADGTAVEHTTDPNVAQEQAAGAADTSTEDAAREQV